MIENKKMTPVQYAEKFVAKCREYGFTYSVTNNVVTIKKIFDRTNEGFAAAEMEASIIFDYVPLKGGSVWGTDGASLGGFAALQNGVFRLNKSGENGKRFAAAVAKIK